MSAPFRLRLPGTPCGVGGAGPGHFQSHLCILLVQPMKNPRLSHSGQPGGRVSGLQALGSPRGLGRVRCRQRAAQGQGQCRTGQTGSVPPSSLPGVYAKGIVRVRGSPIRAVNMCWARPVHAVLCKDRFLFCIQVHSSIYTWPYVHISVPHRVLSGHECK